MECVPTSSDESDFDMDLIRAVGRPPKNGHKTKDNAPVPDTVKPKKTQNIADQSLSLPEITPDVESRLVDKLGEKMLSVMPAVVQKELVKMQPSQLGSQGGKRQQNQGGGNQRNYNQRGGGGDFRHPNNAPASQSQGTAGQPNLNSRPRHGVCFKCGKEGHYAFECWTFSGQVSMSTQTACPPRASQNASTVLPKQTPWDLPRRSRGGPIKLLPRRLRKTDCCSH